LGVERSEASAAPMMEPRPQEEPLSGVLATIQTGLQRLREDQWRRDQQRWLDEQDALSREPFPDWPDYKRGAPNMLIRSAIFSMGACGRRRRVVDLRVPASRGVTVSITGWLMDQHHLDLWLELHHSCRLRVPGDRLTFRRHALLRSVRDGAIGSRDYQWLETRLTDLYETLLTIETASRKRGPGNLIHYYDLNRVSGEVEIETNPSLRWLWESITYLEIAQRRQLGRNHLAKRFMRSSQHIPSGRLHVWTRYAA